MAFHAGAIEASLTAALGDNPALVADLRGAFFESARRHLDTLDKAREADAVREAARRLHGLAASFGAERLSVALRPVLANACLTPVDRRRIARALASLASD